MAKLSGRATAGLVIVGICIVGGLIGVIIYQTGLRNSTDPTTSVVSAQGGSLPGLDLVKEDSDYFLQFKGNDGRGLLLAGIGQTLGSKAEKCESDDDSSLCREWTDRAKLTIKRRDVNDVQCYEVSWQATRCVSQTLRDCVQMAKAHWYGGAEDWYQYWPLELWSRAESPYVAGDSYARDIGGVMERYFFNTNGFGIYIDKEVPLYVSINNTGDNELCLASKYAPPYNNFDNSLPHLNYTVCRARNVKIIHEYMSNKYFKRPDKIPDERLFTSPIWSTWAQYKKDINQSTVMEFANDILSNNFPHSQIEIDDDWTVHYGDMDFNRAKFPDPAGMVKNLTDMGFRTTIWVHPFANIDSMAFATGSVERYFVTEPRGKIPALVSWWRGNASGILDVTNPTAFQWYLNDLKMLRDKYNISSFKFDAGEVPWLPAAYKTNQTYRNPDDYTTLWAELAYQADTEVRHQEVRVGSRSQHLPIFVRMLDRDSNWDYDNGLKTLIPVTFTFGLLGYPFVLPDMIGGNAYNGSLEGRAYPEKELFIRWLELNAFLPSMQFSIVPWNYDDEVINISRRYIKLHEEYSPKIIHLARKFNETGAPIIRPLWWIAPNDEDAQTIDTEFLLGDDLIVAPILERNARNRDIYLPDGRWKDNLRGGELDGGQWHRNYSVALDELAYFTKV
ncbi:myogenesis-regulating glycosidase-like [Liolophura sinensis]|uniref:myogenesis-regulating glycosidase-like n=1 Tax=Liolophura sinensis TaxID=3198878 RepID=UPI003158EEED